ncbi:MAG: pilus assembly protein PilP [Bdellovibrionia bacterium]
MRALRWVIVYSFVAAIALWAAMNLTFRVFGDAQAQAPSEIGGGVDGTANTQMPSNNDTPAAVPAEMLEGGAPNNAVMPEAPTDGSVNTGAETPSTGSADPNTVPPPPTQAIDEITGESLTAPIEKPASSESETFYNYIAEGRRDPFEPFRKIKASLSVSKNAGPDNRADDELDPLERWELDRIKIVAILWDIKSPRAVVMTPDGVTHLVTKGSKIGRNFGSIKDIREGAIVVAEKIFIEGNAKTEIQVMELR